MPCASARDNKKPAVPGTAGFGNSMRMQFSLRFRRGHGACVHRDDRPGGGPCRAARCRDDSAHSIPQATSAGRNLITVFSAVNNLSQIIFHDGAGEIARERSAAQARRLESMPAARARRSTVWQKHFVLSRFARNEMNLRIFSPGCRAMRRRTGEPASAASSAARGRRGGRRDDRAAAAICAKLRKKSSGMHGASRRAPRMRATKNPRRRLRGFGCKAGNQTGLAWGGRSQADGATAQWSSSTSSSA